MKYTYEQFVGELVQMTVPQQVQVLSHMHGYARMGVPQFKAMHLAMHYIKRGVVEFTDEEVPQ